MSVGTTIGVILIWICLILGLIGCFTNKYPGPLVCFIAALIAKMIDIPAPWPLVIIIGVLVAAKMFFLDNYLPEVEKKFAAYTKGAKGTTIGAVIGLIILLLSIKASAGIIILLAIIGFGVLPFAMAYLFEYNVQKSVSGSLESAIGATVTYLCSTFIKFLVLYLSILCCFALVLKYI